MNQPFDVRPAADHDIDQLSEFLNACTLAHQGIARSSPEDIRARIHRNGAEPVRDSFVVRADDRIVGFAHIWRDDPDEIKFFARSHPDERGRGVGALPCAAVRAASIATACDPPDDHDLGGGYFRAVAIGHVRLSACPVFHEDGDRSHRRAE